LKRRDRLLLVSGVVELPQMFLQVEVPAKSFAAHVARERFLVVVRVHVKRQVVHLRGKTERIKSLKFNPTATTFERGEMLFAHVSG
jgi:hypothetical protein